MRINYCLLLLLPVRGLVSNTAIRTAFKVVTASQGVKWPTVLPTVRQKTLEDCPLYDPTVKFPEYYLRDFHAYDGGNLNPVAAVEVFAATEGVMAFHHPGKSGASANEYVRSVFNTHTRIEMDKYGETSQPTTLVDFGCGVGVSTNFLARQFPSARAVYGIDLSPFYLDYAVRKSHKIVYIQRDVANTRLCSNTVDLVQISFVMHELPLKAATRVLSECHRILKPGGVLAVLDMCPNIRATNFFMQKLFDRTEPYMTDYREFCKRRGTLLEGAGFELSRTIDDCNKAVMFFARAKSDCL
ncbi:unnamed protein product [Ectocarpus sp. 6 AP-2014]